MNKYQNLILLLAIISLSCERTNYFKLEKTIINKTNKYLYYCVEANYKYNFTYLNYNESFSMIFDTTIRKKTSFLAYETLHPFRLIISKEELYNLTDTTKSIRHFNYPLTQIDSFYISHIKGLTTSFDAIKGVEIQTLIVTDTLLPIMQKDTSMLTKFKDYYNQ